MTCKRDTVWAESTANISVALGFLGVTEKNYTKHCKLLTLELSFATV